jgi:hypothetical protein
LSLVSEPGSATTMGRPLDSPNLPSRRRQSALIV